MSKGDVFENDLMKLIFNSAAIANLADNASSGPLTALWVGLASADPGEAGSATASEVGYTSYARVGVVRTTAGWTVVNNSAMNAAAVTFPQCGATSASATYATLVLSATGNSKVCYSGALSAGLAITNGITPNFAASALIFTED